MTNRWLSLTAALIVLVAWHTSAVAGAAEATAVKELASRYENNHSSAFCYPGRAQGLRLESVDARSTPRGDWLILTERFANGSAQTMMLLVPRLAADPKVEEAQCDTGSTARVTLRCERPCLIIYNPYDRVSRMMAHGRASRKLVHPGRAYMGFSDLSDARAAAETIRGLIAYPGSRPL